MLLKNASDEMPNVNLTPMLDVVFNLLVFFLVGTKFVEMENSLDLKVPQVSTAGELKNAPARRIVAVLRDGSLTFDGQAISQDQLISQLVAAKTQRPDVSVLVKGDAEGKFQNVADALAACAKAGVAETAISVKLSREGTTRR